MGRENKWFYASIMAAVFAAGAGFHPALAAGITIGTLDPATKVLTPAANTPTGLTLSTKALYGTTYTQNPSHTALSLYGEGTSLTLEVTSSTPAGGEQDIPGLVAAGYVTEAATAATGNTLSLTDQAAITVKLGYHYQDSDIHYSLAGGISSQGAAIDNNVTLNNTPITLVNNPQQAVDEKNTEDKRELQKNWQVSASLVGGAGALTAAGNTVSITDAVITGTYDGVYTSQQNSPLKLNVTGGAALASEATSGMSANHNSVTITQTAAGGTSRGAYGDITGGFSSYGEANNNAVKLENLTGAALDSIYGGVSGINALPDKLLDYNQLTLNDLSQTYAVSYTADNNTVSVSGSNAEEGDIYGGYAASDTELSSAAETASNVTVPVTLTAQASGNTVTVADSTVDSISGGMAEGNLFTSDEFDTDLITISPQLIMHTDANTVKITNSTITWDIYGGHNWIMEDYGTNSYATNPDKLTLLTADENTVYLENSQVKYGVYGGSALDQYDDYKLLAPSPFQGEANGNTVTLVNTAADNKVSVKNVAILGSVVGGYADTFVDFALDTAGALSQNCNNNTVALENVYGFSEEGNSTIYGGWAIIQGDNPHVDSPFVPSYRTTAQIQQNALGNTVTLQGDVATPTISIVDGVYGGWSGDVITIGIPTTAADARFYTDTAASNDNTVSLSNYQSGYVVGGEAELNLSAIGVTDEEAAVSTASTAETVSAPTVTLAAVGTANNNKVSLTGSTITSSVLGGAAVVNTTLDDALTSSDITFNRTHSDTAQGNTVTLAKTKVTDNVIGGLALRGTAAGNTVTIGADSQAASLYGGVSGYGKAIGNTVNLAGGTVANVYGGATGVLGTGSDLQNSLTDAITTLADVSATITDPDVSQSDANGNTVNYYGGTVTDSIIAGKSASAAADNNTVNLYAPLVETGLNLYGGIGKTESTGNTLNVYSNGNSVGNLDHFQKLNFYVPKNAVAGDTMLTVTGDANLAGAAILGGVEETAKLTYGDEVNLLYDANGLSTDGASLGVLPGKDRILNAGFVSTPVEVQQKDKNTIILKVLDRSASTLSPDTKLIAEGNAAALNFIGAGADTAMDAGFMAASQASQNSESQKTFTPYVTIGGQNMRYDTGSYVDSNGYAGNLGLVRRIPNANSVDTIMPFAEYGKGNYTSHLDNGSRGDGTQHYGGVGLLLRRDLNNGVYYEGSFRAGVMDGDFRGALEGYYTTYDTHARYAGASLGLGRIYQESDKDSVDVYGRFNYTHLTSDDVTLHSALGTADYNLDAADSYRTRLGARWTHNYKENQSYYAGLGWDYEFDSTTRATYDGFSTPSPESKGSSAMLELGWKSDATKENPWGADLRLTGWAGKQRGLVFNASITRRL